MENKLNEEVMKYQWVVCCGMIRSGSTLQFLITKSLVELIENHEVIGWLEPHEFSDELISLKDNKTRLVKTHQHPGNISKLTDKNTAYIYIHRDPRDVVLSMVRKSGRPILNLVARELIDFVIIPYYQWTQYDDIYVSRYDQVYKNIKSEIRQIADYLGLVIGDSDLERLSNDLSIDNQKKKISAHQYEDAVSEKYNQELNPDNFLHSNHINSGNVEEWKQEFTNSQIFLIELMSSDVLRLCNYELKFSLIPSFVSKIVRFSTYWIVRLLKAILNK